MKDKIKLNHKVTIFAILLSLVSIGILVFGFVLVSSDKVVMLQSISNLYNKVNENIEDDYTLMDKIATSTNIGIKGDMTVKKDNNEYDIAYNYLENSNAKKSNLALKATTLEETLIDTNFILEKDKLLLFIDQVTSEYYYKNFNYKFFVRGLTGETYEKLVSFLKDAVSDSIDNKDIKKEKVTISLDGKDKKVNKLTYTFDNKKLDRVLKKFFTSIKNDKKVLSDISNFFRLSKKTMKKNLDKYRKDLVKEDREIFSYSTFYYGFNRIVCYDLYLNSKDLLISYKTEKSNSTFKIVKENSEVFSFNSVKDNNTYRFSGIIKNTKLDYTFELFDIDLDEDLDMSFTGTYTKGHLELKTDKYQLIIDRGNDSNDSFKFNTAIKLLDKDNKEIISINDNSEFYFDTEVESYTGDIRNIMELEDKEKEEINNNYEKNGLYQIIPNLFNMLLKEE